MLPEIGCRKPGGAEVVWRHERTNNARPATGFMTVTNLFVVCFWN